MPPIDREKENKQTIEGFSKDLLEVVFKLFEN